MTDRDTIPGTCPEPHHSAGAYAHAEWVRKVQRSILQKVPMRVMVKRYGKSAAEIAALGERLKKGRQAA